MQQVMQLHLFLCILCFQGCSNDTAYCFVVNTGGIRTSYFDKCSTQHYMQYCYILFYSEIRCIPLHVLQTSKNFNGFFCSVNHLSEGRVNANHNVTCSPSLAENDSRLLKNREGNRDSEWIFC